MANLGNCNSKPADQDEDICNQQCLIKSQKMIISIIVYIHFLFKKKRGLSLLNSKHTYTRPTKSVNFPQINAPRISPTVNIDPKSEN